jgi:hypothetical protein
LSKDLWGWGYFRAIILIPFFVKRVIGMRKFLGHPSKIPFFVEKSYLDGWGNFRASF